MEEPDGNIRTLQFDAEGNLVRAQDRLYGAASKHEAPLGDGPMDAPFWQTKIHRDALGLEVERCLPGGLVTV